jgi:hypothetical protein
MDSFSSIFSFSVSMCSALFTFYFWIVKARMERPNLKVYSAEPNISGHAFSSCGDPIKLIFTPRTILANYSSLPNAVLGVRLWLKNCEGAWLPMTTTLDKDSPLPINVAPMETVRLNLTATVELPAVPEGGRCRNTGETFSLYCDRFLPAAPEMKLELIGLGEKRFMEVVSYAPRKVLEAPARLRIAA